MSISRTLKHLLIKTDGTEIELPGPTSLDDIKKMIGAETIDICTLMHLGWPLLVMIVDDNGWETELIDHGGGRLEFRPVKALKPINAKATALYRLNCPRGTTHQIVGDVVVAPDEDFA